MNVTNLLSHLPIERHLEEGAQNTPGQGSNSWVKFGNYSFLELQRHSWLGFSRLQRVRVGGEAGIRVRIRRPL